MFYNDELVPIELTKFCNILLTESSEALHFVGMELVGSLTCRSKHTVTLQIVLANVELLAVGGILAGTVQTCALVVM